jgi:hypothetical protein
MRAHNVLCNSYYVTFCIERYTIAVVRSSDRSVLCNSYNRITVEMNLCSFRSVHFMQQLLCNSFILYHIVSYSVPCDMYTSCV